MPLALPLQRVRVSLQQALTHTIVPVELSGRDRTENASPRREAAWSSLARGVLYRLPIDGRNVQQNELELPGWAVRELRLQVDQRGTGLGPEVPSLSVGLPASELVFLVRGSPPYRLAFGKPGAQSAALPLGVLIPGYTEASAPPWVAPAWANRWRWPWRSRRRHRVATGRRSACGRYFCWGRSAGNNGNEPAAFLAEQAMSRFRAMLFG